MAIITTISTFEAKRYRGRYHLQNVPLKYKAKRNKQKDKRKRKTFNKMISLYKIAKPLINNRKWGKTRWIGKKDKN